MYIIQNNSNKIIEALFFTNEFFKYTEFVFWKIICIKTGVCMNYFVVSKS